jgi:alkaline phosphatase
VVTSDHGNSNPGLNGMGAAYGESTARFERIPRFKASHERIIAEWNGIRNGDVKQLTDLVQTYLDFKLKDDEAAALLDIFNKHNIVEWNHQLEKPEGLLGQISGNHTGIGWTGTSHTSDPTLVSATGPQAERFNGMVINTDVFVHLMEMLG